jgi:hypothetical protein
MVTIDWNSWKTRFTILVFISMILTMVALFTGGWGVYTFSESSYGNSESVTINIGILTNREISYGDYVYEIVSFKRTTETVIFRQGMHSKNGVLQRCF